MNKESSQVDSRKKDMSVTWRDLSFKITEEYKKLLRDDDWTKVTKLHNVNHIRDF